MKRIISILLSALMVVMIIPVSVFMVAAETVTFADKTLAAGESTTETIDLSKVDRTKSLTITMDVKAANATSTANGKDAVLKIGGVRTIRITSGYALHINGYHGSFQQWNNMNGTNNFVITIDFAAATISFVGANRSLTVALSEIGIDVSGDSLVLQFGDADTGACSFKNISVNYTEKAGGGNVEEPDPEPQGPAQLYYNEFDVAMNPNGGTPYNCQRVDDATNGLDGKVMQVYGGGNWTEPVALNNATGTVTLEMRFYNNNFVNGTTLSINGVAIFGADGNAKPKIGDTIVRDSQSAYRINTLTVVIEDLSTGVANVSWVDQYGNNANGTVTLGAISDSFVITLGSYPNSFKVDYIRVIQEVPAAPEIECNVWVDGHQKTAVDGGRYNVRFVAGVGELIPGQTVIGFEISVPAQSKSWDKVTSTVYESITANYGTKTVLASEIGAEYVTAIAITGIPADLGEVVFTVRPYTIVNGETVYGEEVTVTVTP